MKFLTLSIFIAALSFSALSQERLIFNHTEFDFGRIGQGDVSFEHDFIFRNTSQDNTSILSVSSMSQSLDFIFTRSEVFEGEYGFVKAKLLTDTLMGLFHDEIYVTMRQGDHVWSEVLYIRAQIDENATADNGRKFEDSEIAVSVEVLPDDIETMEGFSGSDKMALAENRINYLNNQLELKSELIAKLSADLSKKEESEAENIRQLKQIEESVKSKGSQEDEIIAKIEKLAKRLHEVQKSDRELRNEISLQEAKFDALKQEADSARAYAQTLSEKLEKQFLLQAKAAEQSKLLQRDLARQRAKEAQQRKAIDSLNNKLAQGPDNAKVSEELERLKRELIWKRKEQELQTAHAQHQHKKIDHLKEQQRQLAAQTDSLNHSLKSTKEENELLGQQLEQSNERIKKYEGELLSLKQLADSVSSEGMSESELQAQLEALKAKEDSLAQAVAQKDLELKVLETENDQAKSELTSIGSAVESEQEKYLQLLGQLNKLAQDEGKAKLEIAELKQKLAESKASEKAYAAKSIDLDSRLTTAKLSNEMAFEELRTDVDKMRGERDSIRHILNDGVVYRVNLFYTSQLLPSLPKITGFTEISINTQHIEYGYAVGSYLKHDEALRVKRRLVQNGYPKAEVVAFKDGVQLTKSELSALAIAD